MEWGTVCEQWGPVVGMFILNKLVLPSSLDDWDSIELHLVYNSNESLSQTSQGTWASSSTMDVSYYCMHVGNFYIPIYLISY